MLRVLFAIAFSTMLFLIFYRLIKKNVKPNENIQARIRVLENLDREESVGNDQWQLSHQGGEKKTRRLEDMPFAERVLIPARKYIAERMLRFTPKAIHDYIDHHLVLAGHKGKGQVGTFVFKMLVMGVIFGLIMFYLMFTGDKAFVQKVMFVAMGAVVGLLLPVLALRSETRKRQDLIKRQMPEMLDLLCVSVEAGLSFDAALRKIVERMNGPLIDECRKMLDDVRMGVTRREAMQGIAARCEVQEVSLFVTSVLQAERLGSNMSNTLATQAEDVRERHRQYIKAMALKAPVKIVLPLVGFILPAIFIVALGPAMFNIASSFSK